MSSLIGTTYPGILIVDDYSNVTTTTSINMDYIENLNEIIEN